MINNKYMEMALEVAYSRMALTSPNPPVGAIIVKEGRLISSGGTQFCGGDHAEVCAIKSASESTEGADLYVTLEPCCHHGKTPPCTDAIIGAKIKRVVVATVDRNPKVAGNGLSILKDAGIEVTLLKDYKARADRLLYAFYDHLEKKRPRYIHKGAMTLDGYSATLSGDSKWISSGLSRLVTHRLRSIVDGIIIGKNTFSADNPRLDCRIDSFNDMNSEMLNNIKNKNFYSENNFILHMLLDKDNKHEKNDPTRILLGLPEELNSNYNFFYDDNYFIFISERDLNGVDKRNDCSFIRSLIDREKIIIINGDSREKQLGEISNFLYNKGLLSILIEGGSGVNGSFYEAGLVDEFFIFIAPKILGKGIPIISGVKRDKIEQAIMLNNVDSIKIDKDILYHSIINGYGD